MKKQFIGLLLGFIFQAFVICAQNEFIEGTIIDRNSGEPIPFASITIEGSSRGTAANEEGYFSLPLKQQDQDGTIHITTVGYRPLKLSIKELIGTIERPIKIKLEQEVIMMEEVTVNGKMPDPNEIIVQVGQNSRKNYQQSPFNMEVFSTMIIQDSLMLKPYILESILITYRKGYTSKGQTETKMLEKREKGKNPISSPDDQNSKEKRFRYHPGFDISVLDQIALKTGYSVFNDERRKEMVLKYAGVTMLDADTVYIIDYRLDNYNVKAKNPAWRGMTGKLYVTVSTSAVVKHTMKMGTGTYEIAYKKRGELYYPYFMKSTFIFMAKKNYFVSNTMSVNDIEIQSVTIIENSTKNWFPEDVEYHETFWSKFLPKK